MAVDSLGKVRPGEPMKIPAAAYNAFVDAAKATKGIKQDLARGLSRGKSDAAAMVKNNSGVAIARFGVLGIDGPLVQPGDSLDEFKREIILTGSTPVAATHAGKFVIALEPIAAGDVGRACAVGVCVTQVQFPDPTVSQPEFADIGDGVTANLVAKDRGAAAILWHEIVPGGGGTVWAIVRVGDSNASIMFPVDLTQVGGTDGTGAGPATWTYDVFDALDTAPTPPSIATGVDPTATPSVWARPATGAVVKATAGLAFYDDSGALALAWINEVFAGGSGGDFQAYFVHAVRVGGTIATAPIVGDPATITYDIKVDPVGATADFTGVSPTHSRPTNATGQIIAAAIDDVCAAKIGLDVNQNPIVDELILHEAEPQKLLVANDDEPGATIVAPWVGNAGALVNNPTRLEATPDGSGGTTLKLITNALTMALKQVLPTTTGPDAQDPTDPFANKLVVGSSLSATETILSTVNIAGGGAGGVTSIATVLLTTEFSLEAAGATTIIDLGLYRQGQAIIDAANSVLREPQVSIRVGTKLVTGVQTIYFEVAVSATDHTIPIAAGVLA